MPVQSLITSPSAGDILSAAQRGCKSIKIKGIAWGGGGAGVNRVDVSINDGEDFTRADMLEQPIKQRRRSEWAWVFFEKEVPIPNEVRSKLQRGKPVDLVLTSKALNTAWNVQPESPEPNWNSHGCCVNHWYRVPVTICPKAQEDIKAPDGDFANKPSGGRFATRFVNQETPSEAFKRTSDSKLAQAKGDTVAGCTCGLGCRIGEGCQRSMFDGSPSRLFAQNQRR